MIARNAEDRKTLREGGKRLGRVLAACAAAAVPGVAIAELDMLAERLILEAGGRPAFKGYRPSRTSAPFPGTLCVSVNDEVVHGVPTRSITLAERDLVGLDIGMQWPSAGGLYTDTALTVCVGGCTPEQQRLVEVTERALAAGIAAAAVGSRISDIARAIQEIVEPAGFAIVRDLVGHGVGGAVHEDPQVPNYWDAHQVDTELLDGHVLALEPMVTAGGWRVVVDEDAWTIRTQDHSLAAHAEHTILITKSGTEILTRAA
ncbi:MAG: type I methionyl aminopeptidase [bacterium]|nr:type I methionyl aminopeptidase [bacterium]